MAEERLAEQTSLSLFTDRFHRTLGRNLLRVCLDEVFSLAKVKAAHSFGLPFDQGALVENRIAQCGREKSL